MSHQKRLVYRNPNTGQMIELFQNTEIVHPTPIEFPHPEPMHENLWPPQTMHPPMMPPTHSPAMYPQQQHFPQHQQYSPQGREKGAQLAGMIVFGYLGFWVCAAASPVITIFGWAALSGFLLYRAVKSFT